MTTLDVPDGDNEGGGAVSQPLAGRDRRILGVTFYEGTAGGAIERMRDGGLMIAPAAPALKDITTNASYREALLKSDVVIADSGFMVLIWNLIARDRMRKLSGPEYFRELVAGGDLRAEGDTLWVMASPASAERNLAWLREQGIPVRPDDVYHAPFYGNAPIADEALLTKLRSHRYRHVVVTLGGGTQERLGLYIRDNLEYTPAIHCIGAAIAFFSGDQAKLPVWVIRLYLGWLFRCVTDPMRYVPRYWGARKLLPLMLRYRGELPPFRAG